MQRDEHPFSCSVARAVASDTPKSHDRLPFRCRPACMNLNDQKMAAARHFSTSTLVNRSAGVYQLHVHTLHIREMPNDTMIG